MIRIRSVKVLELQTLIQEPFHFLISFQGINYCKCIKHIDFREEVKLEILNPFES